MAVVEVLEGTGAGADEGLSSSTPSLRPCRPSVFCLLVFVFLFYSPSVSISARKTPLSLSWTLEKEAEGLPKQMVPSWL